MNERRGRIEIAAELLVGMLDLGPGHRVTGCRFDGRTIEADIEGPRMPEVEAGNVPPLVLPIYRRKDYVLDRMA